MSRKQQLSKHRCGIPQRNHNKMLFAGRNIKLEIEYDGSDYCGWQAQKSHKPSIQETIEKALRKILQEKVHLIASGRTDAGVHAFGQIANFRTKSSITLEKLQRALNGILPADIKIPKAKEENPGFHSRFDAKSKAYRYTILNRSYPSVLLRGRAYFIPYPLNVALMRREAKHLLGKHHFKAFCASGSGAKNTVRTIINIAIRKSTYNLAPITYNLKDSSLIVIDIEADGFLYNMVRNIVGTLIEIGRGRFQKGYLKKLLHSKNRQLAGPTAPAHGLCLIKVKY